MMSKNLLNYQKIPHSACCMISILLQKGISVPQCAVSLETTERTIRRILAGGQSSRRLESALTALYVHHMSSTTCSQP